LGPGTREPLLCATADSESENSKSIKEPIRIFTEVSFAGYLENRKDFTPIWARSARLEGGPICA
jgi:hypothetical protein